MLTRLKVDGFKNLDGVDVRFGAFTCIAGSNGVGKSNLFDAIAFLSALADKPLAEAAASVRGSEGRVGDVRSLFRNAGGERAKEMSFLVEMIVPASGTDDLGSEARASMTFLRYELRLRQRESPNALGPLEVAFEKMEHINKTGAGEVLRFPNSPAWRESVIDGRRTVGKRLGLRDPIGGAVGIAIGWFAHQARSFCHIGRSGIKYCRIVAPRQRINDCACAITQEQHITAVVQSGPNAAAQCNNLSLEAVGR